MDEVAYQFQKGNGSDMDVKLRVAKLMMMMMMMMMMITMMTMTTIMMTTIMMTTMMKNLCCLLLLRNSARQRLH